MLAKNKQIISAAVILHSKSGKPPSGQAEITAQTLRDYQPNPKAVQDAQARFQSLGFQVSPFIGISFSITASQSTFEHVFRVTLQRNDKGGLEVVKKSRGTGYELPLDKLPLELQQLLHTVTFTPPPDFGP
ncbi:MAG: hypothetical protein R3B83_11825 [Nitrospirales bacterium]|nr:hypothetical protein [Nitrospirales bacterium]